MVAGILAGAASGLVIGGAMALYVSHLATSYELRFAEHSVLMENVALQVQRLLRLHGPDDPRAPGARRRYP